MKIIAVGWNYRGHNAEMNQKETPQNPIIFFKPETALLKDGKPFFLPQFSDRIEYETELVFPEILIKERSLAIFDESTPISFAICVEETYSSPFVCSNFI